MKSLTNYINEANETKWVAISITTKDYYGKKTITNERVVTLDTYYELKEKGRTRGHAEIVNLEKIGPTCSSKEQAMEFVTPPQKNMRKSKINKGSADYIVWAISMGKLQSNGNTKFDWNLWEETKKSKDISEKDCPCIFADTDYNCFLWGAPNSLEIGDKVYVVDNDSQKKLAGAPRRITAILPATSKEEFAEAYRKAAPDRCKRPSYSFGRMNDGLPWSSMGQIYSIKGVAEEA